MFILFTCMGLSAQQVNLATAIMRAARSVEEVLPRNSKVAVLNFASPSETFSDYVIEELTGELVNGKKVTIVDRRNLALITQELNLQLSGDVSDESAQAIGKMLGAQSIISGTLTNMGTFFRFRIKAISVETAAIQTQLALDLQNDSQVAFLLGGSPSSAQASASAASGETVSGTNTTGVTTPPIEGTVVPGAGLAAKLTWLQRSADSHNTYILEVNANETIDPFTFEFRGGINITVVLRGVGSNRSIRLRAHGTMFTVRSNVTFIIDNNITLQGHSQNTGPMIHVYGGIVKMNNGSSITGNIRSGGDGGGVYVNSGTFEMNGGTISGNNASRGGGVFVCDYTTFTMINGVITSNTATRGGGVYLDSSSPGGTLNMRGGTITANTARERGGGVYAGNGQFNKTGGIITGYTSDQSNGNIVKDTDGYILARSGHAVFVNDNLRKETTAGLDINLTNGSRGTTGGWDR
jgi:TolB-like protein